MSTTTCKTYQKDKKDTGSAEFLSFWSFRFKTTRRTRRTSLARTRGIYTFNRERPNLYKVVVLLESPTIKRDKKDKKDKGLRVRVREGQA